MHKVLKSESLSYLFNTIRNSNALRQVRNSDNIHSYLIKIIILRIFYLSTVTEWNKLDCYIGNVDSFKVFKKRIKLY